MPALSTQSSHRIVNELFCAANDFQRVFLTFFTRLPPRGSTVPAQDNPDSVPICDFNFCYIATKLPSRTAPRHPNDSVTKTLLGYFFTVPGAAQRNPRIRVQVINVIGIYQRVHRRINTGRWPTLAM